MKSTPRFLLILFLLAGFGSQACRAELSEVQVKSAYVFNFIKFVEWPADAIKPGDRIRLCVIGNKDLHASLSALNRRKVGEYEIQIVPHSSHDALSACHVLFIGEQEQRRLLAIIKSLGYAPVLTISDIPGFAERGGGIGLLNRNNKMLFEVNLASTRKADLRLSGQMLNLAANIFGK
ncbi:MAG: YfiR family protein [Sideroxyarcus sp.]|nr:YfiR family protein [Sideroxyarcus sp.]